MAKIRLDLAFAKYWRNSLADSEIAKGAWRQADVDKMLLYCTDAQFNDGIFEETVVKNLFSGEKEETKSVIVAIYPYVFASRLEHVKKIGGGQPEIVMPVVCVVAVDREGRMSSTGKTMIARDLLEPIDTGFSLGTMEAQDDFLSREPAPTRGDGPHEKEWAAYLSHCERLRDGVIHDWPSVEYTRRGGCHFRKADAVDMSHHIRALYDHLCKSSPDVPLFSNYASNSGAADEPCLSQNALFASRVAHSADGYSLADTQRLAIAHFVAAEHGEILTVNGPPGTGKTTMLLSVVATLWVKAALDGGDPPVIVAASNNNQAVTNIIDAFGKDFAPGVGPLRGRWIPDVGSFGAYFPSSRKEAEASRKYQTSEFFKMVETKEYIEKATEQYIEAARKAFPWLPGNASVSDVVSALHASLKKEAASLAYIEEAWDGFVAAWNQMSRQLGDHPEQEMQRRIDAETIAKMSLKSAEDSKEAVRDYLAHEPVLLALLSWLAPIGRKRLARLIIAVRAKSRDIADMIDSNSEMISSVEAVDQLLANKITHGKENVAQKSAAIASGKDVLDRYRRAKQTWGDATSFCPGQGVRDLNEVDNAADKTIRFKSFLLATHYWEGRWLLEMQEIKSTLADEKKRTGRKAVEKRWRRRMMLTPCAVSTFAMLPSHFKCTKRDGDGYADDYLYNFADLLVVDEAGQVGPEVAGASFSLSKRALVIGDTLQLEPIWNVLTTIDIGNAVAAGIASPDDIDHVYDRLRDLGKTASAGSVMKIAQAASRYHYDPDLPRGLFLYEHRRCLTEIIGYCNDLCYHGKLIPSRDVMTHPAPAQELSLPAMGYLHVDGVCQPTGKSNANRLEAATIAAWIADHREDLERVYGKQIGSIVAVITPFRAQVTMIADACRTKGLTVGGERGMTIGTVHSLQGAERPVVIFSPTYSKHLSGRFIDSNPSMLNVGVSRAKDSFLVFGDMDIFDSNVGGPQGLLARALFRSDGNQLAYRPMERHDLAVGNIMVLRDAGEHDAFLREAITSAKEEIMIVTPWFQMSKLERFGAFDALSEARSRGVSVSIYTDLQKNEGDGSAEERESRRSVFHSNKAKLAQNGIDLIPVHKVHSKIISCDNELLCIGSFNWFSAARDGVYAMHETSMVYRGAAVANEIKVNRDSLQERQENVAN